MLGGVEVVEAHDALTRSDMTMPTQITATTLRALAADDDPSVRLAVARAPATPADVLRFSTRRRRGSRPRRTRSASARSAWRT